MKLCIFIFCVFAALARAGESKEHSIAGAYLYDGTTQAIELALLPNGNYLAHWSLDIFPDNGSASGSWRIEGDEVLLTPRKEEGARKDISVCCSCERSKASTHCSERKT